MSRNRARGAMIGALCGDAFGSQVEFMSASSIKAKYPKGLTEIAGSPVWHTAAGQATDDGELALSLAQSIVEAGKYDRAAARSWYRKWYKSSPFDIGGTTRAALCSDSAHPRSDSQANGSLMRIIPLAILGGIDAPDNAALDSGITHPNAVPRAACAAYVAAAQMAIATGDRYAAWRAGLASATGQHIKVCNLRLLPEPLREVVKDAGQNVKAVLEQRRLACISMIPESCLTDRAKRLARVWTAIASAVGRPCRICFAEGQSGSDASFDHVARRLTIYSDVVKPVLFDNPVSAYALGLLAHELAHWKQHGDEHGGSFHSDGEEVGGAIAAYLFEHHDQVRRLLAAHVASDRAVSLSTAAAARHARSMAKRP